MWWAFAAVMVLLVPLLLVRGYTVVLIAWAQRRAPPAARPVLASRLRINLANVIQKLGIIALVVGLGVRDHAGGPVFFLAAGIVAATMAWTIVELFLGSRAARHLSEDDRRWLDALHRGHAFPWRSKRGADAD